MGSTISSIRAYAEGLQANLDGTPEKREKYVSVIMKKCDEVTKITNDMFIHSLHDLDHLILKKEFKLQNQINVIAFRMPLEEPLSS